LEESLPGPIPNALKYALRIPVIGQFLYNILTSRRAIEGYYDRQGYHNPGLITDELVEYVFSSAHQSNSRFPAASLLSGNLNMDVYEALARLQMPIVALWGREESSPSSESSTAFKRVNPRVETRLFDNASQQLQDEQATRFNALIREIAGAPVTQ
jgi:pimeloyl-ACP methyl ester carboxylesterase